MSASHRPIWSQGLALGPQHFQAQDRYYESALDARLTAIEPYGWGIIDARIKSNQLAAGQLALEKLIAVWPDGTFVAADDANGGLPPSRSLGEVMGHSQQSLDVFVGIRRSRGSQATYGSVPGKSRFLVTKVKMPDERGEAEELDVEVAHPNVVVFLGAEDRDDYDCIKVAEVMRGEAGTFAVVDTYVPPLTRASGSPFVISALRRLLSAMHTRRSTLLAARREKGTSVQYHASDITRFLLLNALNQKLPVLEHFVEAGDCHPRELYLQLVELAGTLCSFTTERDITSLPKFNFLALRDTFEPLFAALIAMLSVSLDSNYVSLDLVGRADGIHLADIRDDEFLSAKRFFLAVRSDLSKDEVAALLPRFCKLSAYKDAPALIAAAAPGVPVEHITRPPPEIPAKGDLVYFSIDTTSEYWGRLLSDRRFSLFLPAQFPPETNKVQVIALP